MEEGKKQDINVAWNINKIEVNNKRPDMWQLFFWFGLFSLALSTLILATIYWTRADMRFLFCVCMFTLILWKEILRD